MRLEVTRAIVEILSEVFGATFSGFSGLQTFRSSRGPQLCRAAFPKYHFTIDQEGSDSLMELLAWAGRAKCLHSGSWLGKIDGKHEICMKLS